VNDNDDKQMVMEHGKLSLMYVCNVPDIPGRKTLTVGNHQFSWEKGKFLH
jgi:hypothetical protein